MKHSDIAVGSLEGVRKSQVDEFWVKSLYVAGHLGGGDRANRRLLAALWLRYLYRQSHFAKEPERPTGFGEADLPCLDPAPARQSLYGRAVVAMGPEFGVLYQACCLNLAARPSLLCRALDRLIDWRDA